MFSPIFWATMRIITSTALPACNGISIRIGFAGYVWAAQGSEAASAAPARNRIREFFIVASPVESAQNSTYGQRYSKLYGSAVLRSPGSHLDGFLRGRPRAAPSGTPAGGGPGDRLRHRHRHTQASRALEPVPAIGGHRFEQDDARLRARQARRPQGHRMARSRCAEAAVRGRQLRGGRLRIRPDVRA